MEYAIFLTGPQGHVTAWNAGAERLFGYGEGEARGLHLTHFFTARDAASEEAEREMREAAQKGQVASERWLLRKDGSRFWAGDVLCAIRDEAGGLIGYARIVRDLTAGRDSAGRLDEFLGMLGHELRNPLAPIRNALEVIRLHDLTAPSLRWACGVLDRQVQGLTRLVDDLVQASRITRARIELRKESTELATVVDRAVETARPLIDARGHELVVVLPAGGARLEADVIRLSQALSNLLDNAARYTPEPGHIRLSAERQGNQVEVRVRDDGEGIPTDMLEAIFFLFVQVGRSLARSQGGLGVGLTVVRSLVEMHGGTVEARSEGPGKGSEFVVRLPVRAEAPARADSTTPDAGPPPPPV